MKNNQMMPKQFIWVCKSKDCNVTASLNLYLDCPNCGKALKVKEITNN